MKKRPSLAQLIRSEQQEAARVRRTTGTPSGGRKLPFSRFLDGEDISQESPLWHAPGIPTFYNAVVNLAPRFGIAPIAETITAIATDEWPDSFRGNGDSQASEYHASWCSDKPRSTNRQVAGISECDQAIDPTTRRQARMAG